MKHVERGLDVMGEVQLPVRKGMQVYERKMSERWLVTKPIENSCYVVFTFTVLHP